MDKQPFFDKLSNDQQAVSIPYYLHEGEMYRLERINRRIWILLIVLVIALIGTNAGWIVYESQFEDVYVSQEVDTGEGAAVVSGTGNAIYGEDQADGQTAP